MRTWELQETKSRFSEDVDRTMTEGPQLVTQHGAEAVVVLPAEDYHGLVNDELNMIDHLLNAPGGEALVITRPPETIRDLDL